MAMVNGSLIVQQFTNSQINYFFPFFVWQLFHMYILTHNRFLGQQTAVFG